MSSHELVIDQAGATGVVAELFRQVISNPELHMQLGEVATAQANRVGKRLGTEDPTCPPQWADKRLISIEDLAHGGSGSVVFSGLRADQAVEHEDSLAVDRLEVTNSAANRMREDVPLVSTFVNADQIDKLYDQDLPGRIIAGGNCKSAMLAVALAPIHREIGIVSMHVETLQGWSGTGAREVPEGVDEIRPIIGDEQSKIETEPNKFLGTSLQEPAQIAIVANPHRAPWLRGHHAIVRAQLERETSVNEIQDLMRSFDAPKELETVKTELRAISQIERVKWPRRHQHIKPIKLLYHDLVRYDTHPPKLTSVYPMRVKAHVIEVDESDPRKLTLEEAGNNLLIGSVGGNILNIVYARAKGYV
jgi:aspartate-semialdehyde dehydrogenase